MYLVPPLRAIQPVRALAIATVAALGLTALMAIALVVPILRQIDMIDRLMVNPSSVTEAEATANDLLLNGMSTVRIGTVVLCAILFLVWLMRARSNAESLVLMPHRRNATWAIFGWAVPVVSLWYPKQIVDDIWSTSQPEGLRTGALQTEPRSSLVWAWWLAWLGSLLVGRVGDFMANTEDMGELKSASWAMILGLVVTVAAAVLAALVVLQITKLQEARRQ